MDGVLVIDKPRGMTSHDVVDEVRRRLRTRRVGHAGTLDPDATGVLLVGVGRATRFLAYAQGSPKRYRAAARLGVSTTTQDASGEVVEERPAPVSAEQLGAALGRFVGDIEQVPPMVSAVRMEGERLYRKARRGELVERVGRRVTVYELGLVDFSPGARPEAVLDVRCSAGTYVRTLVHDLGAELGCGAHLTALRRTEAAGFTEGDAAPLERVTPEALRPLADAVRELRRIEIDEEAAALVANGRPLPLPGLEDADPVPVALVRGDELLAVYRPRGRTLVADRVVPR